MKQYLRICVVAVIFSLFSNSGFCADWNFYGSVKLQVFNYDSSQERVDNLKVLGTTDPYDNFQFKLDKYTSQLGATVTHKDLTSVVEICPNSNDFMRLWYGSWDFGIGELLIGQSWTPLNMLYSSAVAENDNGLLDYGALYELRHPMIQVKFKGLTLALVEPGAKTKSFYSRAIWGMQTGTAKTKMPKIEAKYTHEIGPAKIDFYGGYNSYDFKLSTVNKTISIDSYVVGTGLTMTFNDFKISGATYSAKNAGPMGLLQSVNYSDPQLDAHNTVIDNDSFAWLLVASYIVNDTIRVEAGLSSLTTELDDEAIWSKKDETEAMYFQIQFTVFDKFLIVPEVGYIDYKTNYLGKDTGDKTYFGTKFQYNF